MQRTSTRPHVRRSKPAQRRSGLDFGHFDYDERPLPGNRAVVLRSITTLIHRAEADFAASATGRFVRLAVAQSISLSDRFEPEAEVLSDCISRTQQTLNQCLWLLRRKTSGRSCAAQRTLGHRRPSCGTLPPFASSEKWIPTRTKRQFAVTASATAFLVCDPFVEPFIGDFDMLVGHRISRAYHHGRNCGSIWL